MSHTVHRLIPLFLFACATIQAAQAEPVSFKETYATSWIGNSFSEGTKLWMPDWQNSVAVAPDGTIFVGGGAEMFGSTVLKWDAETGKMRIIARYGRQWDNGLCAVGDANGFWVGGFKNGLARFPLVPGEPEDQPRPTSHLIETGKISGVVVVGKELFALDVTRPPPQPDQLRADIQKEKDPEKIKKLTQQLQGAVKVLAERERAGLSNDPTIGRIRVFDVEKLTELRSWAVPIESHHLSADDRGRLWTVVKAPEANKPQWTDDSYAGAVVRAWNLDGSDPGLQLAGLDEPRTVAWDGTAKRLLIGTGGETHQVLEVDVSGKQPKVAGTFGVKGGVWAEPPGRMGPGRFRKITAIAVDAQGHRFISCDYGGFGTGRSAVEVYAPDGKRRCFVYNVSFCEGAVVDPQDETSVYSSRFRFRMDWSQTTPGSEATLEAITHDRERSPDGRGGSRGGSFTQPVALLRIAGKPFLTYSLQPGGSFWVNRFEGEVAVPCAFFGGGMPMFPGMPRGAPGSPSNISEEFPKPDRWITALWVDRNGDKRSEGQPTEWQTLGNKMRLPHPSFSFAADGSIWFFGKEGWGPNAPVMIGKIPCEGLDEHGVPRWDFDKRVVFPAPPNIGDFRTATYDDASDSLYIQSSHDGIHRLTRWDGYATTGKPVQVWESARVPHNDTAHTPGLGYGGGLPRAIRQAGKYLFIAYGWQAVVSIWDKETGCYVGTLTPVGIPPNYDGCLDAEYGHSAFLRKNGEYVVFAETAGCGRVNLYRWKPHPNLVGTNGLTATADSKDLAIALAWGAAPGVERWRLERKGGVDGQWRQITELPVKTQAWRDTGLWAGTVYSYRLLAVKGSYVSAPSFVAYESTMEPDLVTGEPIGAGPATAPGVDGVIASRINETDAKMANWVGLDAGKPVVATRVRLMPADIFQGDGALAGGRIQGAMSPEGPWTDLSRGLENMPVRQWTDIPLRAPTATVNAVEEILGAKAITPDAFRCFRLITPGKAARLAEMRVVTSVLPTLRLLPREIQAVQPGKDLELSIETTDDLLRVDYTLDGRLIGTADKPPFGLRWKAPPEAGAWTLRAIAVTKRGLAGPSNPTVVHTPGKFVLRRNCMGPVIPGWSVDGGETFSQGGKYDTAKPIDLTGAVDPAPLAVYRTAHWDPRVISTPGLVPYRTYVVRMHFADIDGGQAAAGQRLFNIAIADRRITPTIDVAGEAGGPYRALTRTFLATANHFGALEIHVNITRDSRPHRAILNGLELIDPLAATKDSK